MKVSKEQLKALIKEELDAVMKEAELEEADEKPKKIRDTYGREVTKAFSDESKAQDKKNALASIKKQTLKGRIEETELEEAEMTEMKGLDKLDPKHSEMAMQARQDRGRLISDKDFYDDAGNQTVSEWIEETLELLNVDPASPEAMALEQKLRAIAKEHVLDDEDEDELGENKLGLEEKEDKQMKQIAESFRRFTKILKD